MGCKQSIEIAQKVLLIIAHGFSFVQTKEDIFGTSVCYKTKNKALATESLLVPSVLSYL
jgi:hypothetical protein